MAASEESCDGNPDFAVICSFIAKFGDDCGVNVTIPCLQQMLEDTKNVHEDLVELHIHLLRRGRKRVTKERWEKSLIKFCHEYSSVDAWELERFGYKKAKLSVKLELLKRLLELQFDANGKFKSEVNKIDAQSLRIPPVGRDVDGQMYWYQLDKEYNMRLYRQGVGDESAWQLLCSTTEHLKNLLSSLEKNITNTTGHVSDDSSKKEDMDDTLPKMETGSEDLTSCMSETKPCTIIIKTERKDLASILKASNATKMTIKDSDTKVAPVEKDQEVATKTPSAEPEIKVEHNQDNQSESSDIVIKKEICPSEKKDIAPMEVDDTNVDKEKDSLKSSEKVLVPEEVLVPEAPKNDVEMIDVEVSCADRKSPANKDASKEITDGRKTPETPKSLPVQEQASEVKFKGSKIKLYEKWSNEKKQAAAAHSTEEIKQSFNVIPKRIETTDSVPEDLTVGHKASSQSALSKLKPLKVSPNKLTCDAATPRGDEVPMDLSVSCRSSSETVNKSAPTDLTASSNRKRPLPDVDKTSLSYNGGGAKPPAFPVPDSYKTFDAKYANSSEAAPRPFKKKHLSMAMEDPVLESTDQGRKSVIFEVKNNKLCSQYQDNRHGSDSGKNDRTSNNSGFSHLQALQNMCNENPMTCFQGSVIHSAAHEKGPKSEDGFSKYSFEKSYNEVACDSLSKKYGFSSSQLPSDLKHVPDAEEPAPLLKSNVSLKEHTQPVTDISSSSTSKEILGQNLVTKCERIKDPCFKESLSSSSKPASIAEKHRTPDKCVKTHNQKLSVSEKDSGNSKNFQVSELTKHISKEKHSTSLAKPIPLEKNDEDGLSARTKERISTLSEVKHSITSVLKLDVVGPKFDNLISCTSTVTAKPSHVPVVSVTDQTDRSIVSKCDVSIGASNIIPSKDKLPKVTEKDPKDRKSPKIELKKEDTASVPDSNIPVHGVKKESTESLPEKCKAVVSDKVCSAPVETHSTIDEPMDVDVKSHSLSSSKSDEVPVSVTEQKFMSAEFLSVSDKKSHKSPSPTKFVDRIFDVKSLTNEKSTISSTRHKSDSTEITDNDVCNIKKVESRGDTISNKLPSRQEKPNSPLKCDSSANNNFIKSIDSVEDTVSARNDSSVSNVPKVEVDKAHEKVEPASTSTEMSSENNAVPYKSKKCDNKKGSCVDAVKGIVEESNQNSSQNIASHVPECALDLNKSSVDIKQNQSSNNERDLKGGDITTPSISAAGTDGPGHDKKEFNVISNKDSEVIVNDVASNVEHRQSDLKPLELKSDKDSPFVSSSVEPKDKTLLDETEAKTKDSKTPLKSKGESFEKIAKSLETKPKIRDKPPEEPDKIDQSSNKNVENMISSSMAKVVNDQNEKEISESPETSLTSVEKAQDTSEKFEKENGKVTCSSAAVLSDQSENKTSEDSENKITETSEKKTTERSEKIIIEKSKMKGTEKSEMKSTEKSEMENTGKSEKKIVEKSQKESTEKSEKKVVEKSQKKSTEKSETKIIEKSETKSTEKPETKGTEKSEMKGTEKSEMKGTEKSEMKGSEKSEIKGSEKSEIKGTEKSEMKGTEKSEMKGTEKSEMKGSEKSEIKGTEKSEMKGTEKSEKEISEKSEKQITEKSADNIFESTSLSKISSDQSANEKLVADTECSVEQKMANLSKTKIVPKLEIESAEVKPSANQIENKLSKNTDTEVESSTADILTAQSEKETAEISSDLKASSDLLQSNDTKMSAATADCSEGMHSADPHEKIVKKSETATDHYNKKQMGRSQTDKKAETAVGHSDARQIGKSGTDEKSKTTADHSDIKQIGKSENDEISKTNADCPKAKPLIEKSERKIDLPKNNVDSSESECKKSLKRKSLKEHSVKESTSENKMESSVVKTVSKVPKQAVDEVSEKSKGNLETSVVETLIDKSENKAVKDTDHKTSEREAKELKAPVMDVTKTEEISHLQQEIDPLVVSSKSKAEENSSTGHSSINSAELKVKEDKNSDVVQENSSAEQALKAEKSIVSVSEEILSKENILPKSSEESKIEEAKDSIKEDSVNNTNQKKKSQRASNRSSRSSRTRSRSKSNSQIKSQTPEDIQSELDPLLVESPKATEDSECAAVKKEADKTKITKNGKHVSLKDIKSNLNKDSIATTIEEKEIERKNEVKKECLEIPKKTTLSGVETKYDLSLCKINIKNSLDLYLVMHSRCLETKGRHPNCGELSQMPLQSTSPAKPKLLTTFSMDTTDDVQIIECVVAQSPTKKKRGRLRQRTSVPPVPPPPVRTPAAKSPAKTPRQRAPRNSKKPATSSGKDSFTIPEGFLEILSNSQSEGISNKTEPQRKSRGQKLKISVPSLQSSESESAPIKRSRRIQEQHQKKMSELAVEMEREQRIIEQLAKKTVKKSGTPKPAPKVTEPKPPRAVKSKFQPPTPEETCMETKRATRKMNSRSRNMTKMTLMYEDESKDSEFSTSRETEKSKKRRRGKGARKGYKPWDLSSESSSSLEELTEEEEEEHEEPLVFEVNEDEFACEEVDEDAEPIIVRRARTAKKVPEDTNTEETAVTDDKPCSKCGKYDKPEWILLCDKCDNGYHTHCLIPPLMIIPEGDWYCQPCEHQFLCEFLQKELHNLELVLKQREREELRKQRLAYVGISLDNVLKPEKKEKSDESSSSSEEEKIDESESKGRRHKESSDDERHKKLYGKRSVRARRNVNYQFKEYDELIASAIQEEMLGGKLTEDEEEFKGKEKDEDSDKPFKASIPKPGRRRKRASRLNDLDLSDVDDDSGEEYKGSSSDSEHTAPRSSQGSDAESAASGEWRIVKTKGRSRRKPRRGRRGSSDEEWDENDSDTYRPTTRRAAQKAISYREISSDDDEWNPKPKVTKKRKMEFSSGDSEASFKKKKKPKRKSRVRKWASSSSEEESEQSMSFSRSSQGSEDEWKVKKSSEGNRLKININKKVLSSDENDESQESAPKKRPNKIVSEAESEEEDDNEDEEEEEEEEEESSEEDDDDDEEEDEEDDDEEEDNDEEEEKKKKEVPKLKSVKDMPPKTEVKPAISVKEPVKMDVPKVVKISTVVKESAPVVEPVKEKAAVAPVKDKAPPRTVKKEATKMVPCSIPYVKSPKSGHGTTPEEESDKETSKDKKDGASSVAKQLPISKKAAAASAMRPPNPSARPYASTIIQPFSNIDDENDSDDEVPLERIPTSAPVPLPTKSLSFSRESEYTPAKELPGFSYTAPEEKCFPPTYSSLAPFQDYSSRPSPLKPSLVETYSNNSSPSKLTPLDSYSQTSSPKGFISLDSYSDSRKKKQHFYGTPEPETAPRPVPEGYQGEIRFPPSPSSYSQRSPSHVPRDTGTPPRFHSQYPDAYAPPRSPEYYQNHQYYPGEERVPRPAYQPNYVPPEQGPPFVPNPYVATPVPQPNGGFMIDTLLRARNPETEEDELTGVTDIVSYITQE